MNDPYFPFIQPFMRQVVLILLYTLLAFLLALCFAFKSYFIETRLTHWESMIEGTASRPFVYRTLVPTIVRGIEWVTPEQLKEKIVEIYCKKAGCSSDSKSISSQVITSSVIIFGLHVIFFIGLAFALRELIKDIYPHYPFFIVEIMPMMGLLFLPLYLKNMSYIYDPSTLLLFALGFLVLIRQQTLLFYLVFFLTCLNKETAVLLIFAFIAVYEVNRSKLSVVLHVAGLLILFGAIKSLLFLWFRNNVGEVVEFWFFKHNLTLWSAVSFPELLFFAFKVFLFCYFVFTGWNLKNVLLKRIFMFMLAPFLILVFLWGWVDETRVYFELFPIVFLLSLPTGLDLFNFSYNYQREVIA